MTFKPVRTRTGPQKTLVGFVLGEVHYAIDVSRVLQIVKPLPMTILPHLPPAVVAVAEHRGEVLPVIDLRARFNLQLHPVTRQTKWILLALGLQPAAVVVDGITDVFGTAGGELRPAPGIPGEDQRGILGVTSYAGRLTFVLDIDRLRTLISSLPQSVRQSLGPSSMGSSTARLAALGAKL